MIVVDVELDTTSQLMSSKNTEHKIPNGSRLAAAVATSRVVAYVSTVKQWQHQNGLADSRTVTVGQQLLMTITRWVKHSAGYQWLTAEPDPQVIVIDLRESIFVGPVIRVLDRLMAGVGAATPSSRMYHQATTAAGAVRASPLRVGGLVLVSTIVLHIVVSVFMGSASMSTAVVWAALGVLALVGYRDRRSWAELRETRVVEWIVAAFEPPEPPTDGDDKLKHEDNESIIKGSKQHNSESVGKQSKPAERTTTVDEQADE